MVSRHVLDLLGQRVDLPPLRLVCRHHGWRQQRAHALDDRIDDRMDLGAAHTLAPIHSGTLPTRHRRAQRVTLDISTIAALGCGFLPTPPRARAGGGHG